MKVETYVLRDWNVKESGLFLAENDEWILVKHIPVDYVIDGYRLYKKEYVEERIRAQEEKRKEKVLRLKGVGEAIPENFRFSNTLGMLEWVENIYGVFEFQDDEETELFYGKINQVRDDKLIIDMIDVNGKTEKNYDYEFSLKKIRVITFETDYHTSIILIWKNQQNKKTL